MPLVKGQYPTNNPLQAIIGRPGTTAQANVPVRSNLEYLGLASAADGAALVTNKLICVAVPVDWGTTYSTVTFVAGATAPTLTINYAAVYAGMGTAALSTLLAQSANAGATAPTVSVANSYTLATAQLATAANAPFGFWFVGLQQTGTANSAASVSVAAAIDVLQAAVFTHAPFALGFSVAATTATAPATLASPTTVALKPFIWLS
jgi:hypothetical protein